MISVLVESTPSKSKTTTESWSSTESQTTTESWALSQRRRPSPQHLSPRPSAQHPRQRTSLQIQFDFSQSYFLNTIKITNSQKYFIVIIGHIWWSWNGFVWVLEAQDQVQDRVVNIQVRELPRKVGWRPASRTIPIETSNTGWNVILISHTFSDRKILTSHAISRLCCVFHMKTFRTWFNRRYRGNCHITK